MVFENLEEAVDRSLFPTDVPEIRWAEFEAAGFTGTVAGLIHRDPSGPAVCGMPLGGIDTGCIDLETSGMWGYSTIFNSHVPRSGPLNVPFLGMAVGEDVWVLSTLRSRPETKGPGIADRGDEFAGSTRLELGGVRPAEGISYWGHYPVADLEYQTGAPVSVGLRAWSPFMPGDVESSMIPGAVFEVHLRNTDSQEREGTIAISFPGPTEEEAGEAPFSRSEEKGAFTGVTAGTEHASYALGAIGEEGLRVGGPLGTGGRAWAEIADHLPTASDGDFGASCAVDFALAAGEHRAVRFVLTWHSPRWRAGGSPGATETNAFTHMYATRFSSALEAARRLAAEHEALLGRILAWQQVIYAETQLPIWLRESLVNNLYLITEDGLWAAAEPPIPEWVRPRDGLSGMNESPRGCPQIECIPCGWYGNVPLVYFFPELALSTLRGYRAYQDDEGCPPWVFGGCTTGTPPCEMTRPSRGYQVTQNGANYTDMACRYWLCRGDGDFLKEFYPSLKQALIFTMDLNRGPDGVISFPDRRVSVVGMPWESEAFEFCEWHGMAAHIGGIHLAQLRMVEDLAEKRGDTEFVEQCRQWIDQGTASMEEKMWAGRYYLNFWEPETGKKMDAIFGYQLDGQWMVDFQGLAPVFRQDRIGITLETIKQTCATHSEHGVVNFANPDGSVMQPSQEFLHSGYEPYDFFPPELLILAMTYMYQGRVDFGLELARRCMQTLVVTQRRSWDAPNIVNGRTGEVKFGNDYYQNLMLWSLPAALGGKDVSGPCRSGGLVDRIIKAATAQRSK